MSDLISRQEAKDAIDMALDHIDHVPPWVYDKLLNVLNEVPSAEKAQLSGEDATKDATSDLISRKELLKQIDIDSDGERGFYGDNWKFIDTIESMPSAEPERLTDDDFETIRIHLNAQKEKLCNQQRWEEAEEYQRIIDRFIAFASAEPEWKKGVWICTDDDIFNCSECDFEIDATGCIDPIEYLKTYNFCPNCGADMRGEKEETE